MQLDGLISKRATAGELYDYKVGKGHLNGLNIQCPIDSELTIRLRRDDGNDVLMQQLPVHMLIKKSNMENGYNSVYQENINSVLKSVQYAFGQGNTTEFGGVGIAKIFTTIGNTLVDMKVNIADPDAQQSIDDLKVMLDAFQTSHQNFHMTNQLPNPLPIFRVDLGSIFLDDGDELDIQLKVNDVTNFTNDVVITSFSENDDPFHIEKYTRVSDNNTILHDVEQLYAYVPDKEGARPTQQQMQDISIQLDIDDDTAVFNMEEAMHSTVINSEIEGYVSAGQILPMIYESKDEISESVYARVNGLTWGSMEFLVISDEMVESKTKQKVIKVAKKKLAKIERLETKRPKRAAAMRSAGLIPSSRKLRPIVSNAVRSLRKRR